MSKPWVIEVARGNGPWIRSGFPARDMQHTFAEAMVHARNSVMEEVARQAVACTLNPLHPQMRFTLSYRVRNLETNQIVVHP